MGYVQHGRGWQCPPWGICPAPQAHTTRKRLVRIAHTYSTEAPGRTCQHSLRRSRRTPRARRAARSSACVAKEGCGGVLNMCGELKPRSGPEGAGLPGAATERLSTGAEWPGYLPRSQHRRRCRHALGWRRSGGRSRGRRRRLPAARSVSACEPHTAACRGWGRPNFRHEGREKRTQFATMFHCSLHGNTERGRTSPLA